MSVLITGPSDGGIGAETATCLAAGSPSLIILAGRSLPKIQPVIDRIHSIHPEVKTKFISIDLSNQSSVREAASIINASVEKIDVLINNAAIMACPFGKTVDGIETQFGTNHIGHFLLTNLIMPKILAAGHGARIVNVSSLAHRMVDVRLEDWNFEVGSALIGSPQKVQILTQPRTVLHIFREWHMAQPKRLTSSSRWHWRLS
jgi:NAD(P)-dependent dehydrogenase (short-subunit alcohol dehydrogenase family)